MVEKKSREELKELIENEFFINNKIDKVNILMNIVTKLLMLSIFWILLCA